MRQFNLNVVITLVLLLVLSVAINCPYDYVEVFRTDGQSAALKFDEESTLISGRTISMAGWPWKFLVQMSYADLPTATAFSFASLLANIALWAIAIVVLTLYEHRIYRALVKVNGQKRRLTLFDLLAATSFFALLAGYWQYSQSLTAKELRLADQISNRGGRTVETLLLPRPWVGWMSNEKFWTIRRISEVTLNLPDDALIQQTVALPYLQRLSIGGGEYDLTHLKELNNRPLLSHLRLSGRKLDPPTVTLISSLLRLQSLNLMRTNVTADALPQLATLPRLQLLNLLHSDVRLENFTSGAAFSHVRELYLPRPKNGQGDSLRLANCPELKKLVCNAYDQPLNSSPVHLELSSLPALQSIELDAFQLFNLRCSHLPELSQISPLHLQYQMRCSKSGVPAQLWLGSVELSGVEKLKSLASSAEELQLLSVEGHPDLHVALSNERLEDERSSGRVGNADRSVSPASRTLSKLFESLASENGPSRFSLRGLDLRGMDFAMLSRNQRLSYVDIWDSRLKPNQ
ncbi:MAG: hypothetical protein IT423_20605, partial [Pirellulaceae bacterium]|nr:hypothetical protein [Pirellulaceae bacterium]